jgi:hypothetical protein
MLNNFKRFDAQNLFNQALINGIDLFCGAGFSVEAKSAEGKFLPIGNTMLNELKSLFPSLEHYTKLSRACTKLQNTNKKDFCDYLKKRFTVSEFSDDYLSIQKVNIKNIFTTNIDDLCYKIFDNMPNGKYLNDASINGTLLPDENEINYYALHGCVLHNDDNYIFGAMEVASAYSHQGTHESWQYLASGASKNAILFWGWNFEDNGPIEAMYGKGNSKSIGRNIKRWVLIYEDDANDETTDFLSSLGFNLIIGDTAKLLHYIDGILTGYVSTLKVNTSFNPQMKKYQPPASNENVVSYPLKSYFLEFAPRWSYVISHTLHKISYFKYIADHLSAQKDVIVIGVRASGKTTLMMQLLIEFECKLPKYQMVAPSIQQAREFVKLLGSSSCILFVDDCFRDTYALKLLLQLNNIYVVGFDRDFNYEGQRHQLLNEKFELVDITYISDEDAQSILETIPKDLIRENYSLKNFWKDPSIINLIASALRPTNYNFFRYFSNNDAVSAEVFLLICYIHASGTPCSFDMIYSYLGDNNMSWKDMLEATNRIGGLVKDCNMAQDFVRMIDSTQDYWQCRSRFFAEKVIQSINKEDKPFSNMLMKFVKNVPPYRICQYDRFKRSGYDADFAQRAFPNTSDGESFYEICANKDESEYIYQQAAVYFQRMKEYSKAFEWIDRARNLSHYNRFSIDSTYANIYFDKNYDIDIDDSMSQENALIDALNILDNCCRNDKRKAIHLSNYASRAIKFCERYNSEVGYDYLRTSNAFIQEELDKKNLGIKSKFLLKDLQEKISVILSQIM